MTADRPRAFNSTLPARTRYMNPGRGLSRSSLAASGTPLGSSVLVRGPWVRSVPAATGSGVVVPLRPRRAASPAEFSPRVRKLVRDRSGGACEACGVHLPPGCGQYQHRVARGIGGSRNPVLGSPSNCCYLCPPCHARAESRDREMYRRGFYRESWEDPGLVPILRHGTRGKTWLVADGTYSTEPPEGSAA